MSVEKNQNDQWGLFADEVEKKGFSVRRENDPPLIASEPQTNVKPHVWKWDEIKELLRRAGEIVSLGGSSGSERRGIRLVNPGLPYGSTHTLWGTIQLVKPGETAFAHRHTPSALRYIIRGGNVSTTVEGEMYPMERGDFLITPNWAWHEHSNRDEEDTFWLDVLDIPLVQLLNSSFFELHPEKYQKVGSVADPSYRRYGSGKMRPVGEANKRVQVAVAIYKFSEAYAALQAFKELPPDPYDDIILEYINPSDGGHVMDTIACYLQLLRPGIRTKAHRHTYSALYHVYSGEGRTIVGDQVLHWKQGDTFAIPPWAIHSHENISNSTECLLFSTTDRPVYEKLGLYREQGDV